MASMEEIAQVLDELFVIFNFGFFEGLLQKPVLTVQSNSRRNPSIMGWCTTQKAWRETETKEELYEICVCPEFFDLGIGEIGDTLLHELVHLYHKQEGIQDVSRGGQYHNKIFKQKAEECGLNVGKCPKNGWSQTSLKPETREFIETLCVDRDAFNLMRKREFVLPGFLAGILGGLEGGQAGGSKPEPRQTSSRKYVCPSCRMTVRATRDVFVKCGDCDETMEKVEKDQKRASVQIAASSF